MERPSTVRPQWTSVYTGAHALMNFQSLRLNQNDLCSTAVWEPMF